LPFVTTKKILNAFLPPEEFHLIVVYAPLGYGKSAYSIKVMVEVLMEVYNMRKKEAWEKVKQFIFFHPQQFLDKLEQIKESGLKRVPGLIWDDAGLWCYALEWWDPLLIAIGKYLNVARTRLACLICTTPTPAWIFKKLRKFPQAINIKILKRDSPRVNENGEEQEDFVKRWSRLARAYLHWTTPDMKKSGVRRIYEDEFLCYLPDSFYSWYKPLRDAYEQLALNLIREELHKIGKKSKAILLENYPELTVPKIIL